MMLSCFWASSALFLFVASLSPLSCLCLSRPTLQLSLVGCYTRDMGLCICVCYARVCVCVTHPTHKRAEGSIPITENNNVCTQMSSGVRINKWLILKTARINKSKALHKCKVTDRCRRAAVYKGQIVSVKISRWIKHEQPIAKVFK